MIVQHPGYRARPSAAAGTLRPLYLALSLAVAGLACQATAHAQEADSKAKTLDTIDVKANARSAVVSQGSLGNLSNLETPFSTVEASAEKVADLQPASVYALFASDASISRQSGGDFTAWSSYLTIRGIPVASTAGATKLNGLPTMLFGITLPMEMMQGVRILKGASGFMYGFAAPGGIVDYVTKKPTDGFLLSADVGYRSDNLLQEHVDFGDRTDGPHHFGYRINASHQEGDSNRGTGVKKNAFAVSLDADITSTLRWNLDAIYQKMSIDKPMPMAFLTSYTSPKLPHISTGTDNPQADNAYDDTKFWEANTGLYWQISDDWNLRMDVAKSRSKTVFSIDYLYLLDASGRFQDRTYDGYYTYNYEMARTMLQGTFALGPTTHNVVVGVNYQTSDNKLGYSNLTQGYVAHGYRYLGDGQKLVYTPTYGKSQQGYPTSGDLQRAVFASDTVDFSPQWSALLGVRYTQYEQYNNAYKFSAGEVSSRSRTTSTAYSTSPTVAVMYKPIPDATVYASYVEALEAGNTVGATYVNYGQQLGPIKSKQYETGFKLEKGLVNASLALFRLDRGTGYANSENYYVQSGISRYQGVDASLSWRVVPSLRLSASAVYLDKSDYVTIDNAWLKGKQVSGGFRASGALGAEYSPQWLPGASVNVNARATGETTAYQNITRQLTLTAPGYTLYDVGFKYAAPYGAHQVTYRVGVNNLFNKAYWIGGSNSFVFLGDPRAYYANVSFDF
ncbi:TonB-dependent siderophore receptor [Xanthomonas massiliensis]|uniref:TonB-dependent siderophore receptor n=1 Tax=Xanthomonas massiliensis TaxID=1720302 RepID=UPI000826EEB6|nr:TonB-dependent siderophore receptor [Xanthomonas massiliensis]